MTIRLLCLTFVLAQLLMGAPIPIKVVVVTMFEIGADLGDGPGEFQLWVEREQFRLRTTLPARLRVTDSIPGLGQAEGGAGSGQEGA